MSTRLPCPDAPAPAPPAFRDALAEVVQIGLSVARLVGRMAEAETAAAEAASPMPVAEGVFATSLAEAIAADEAAVAAAEARQSALARAETIAAAFARVSRAIRMTVWLAERLDRGWARRGLSDDRHAMARRQIARGVIDAIGREAAGERAERLTETLSDRLESLDVEYELANRPVDEVIRQICRDLGLDTVPEPLRDAARLTDIGEPTPLAGGGPGWKVHPPQRRPDG